MPLPGTGRSVQRCAGFSLVETVLAGALFAVIALVALEALRQLEGATRHLAARHTALTAIERLDATLRAEARSAIAIWSASSAAGEGADGCVELDFAAVDAGGPSFWSYRAFPRHGAGDAVPADALERVAARGPLAPCDPALHGAVVLRGLRAPLSVQSILPQNVAAHADPYLAVPDSPYVGASVPAVAPAALPLRDARGAALTGGNVLIEARFDTDAGSRVVDLLPGTLPTGFSEELHYTCSERCDVG
ncbi:MAG: hypothetical protein JOZ24_11220, partial [Candidatus Eremiobacteraeota bacterium]|nr:hypothetical protein [Candidatus Eremiobacteraeota bacterium]